jgi:hypothetical protein
MRSGFGGRRRGGGERPLGRPRGVPVPRRCGVDLVAGEEGRAGGGAGMVGGWAAAEFPARGGGRIDGEWEVRGMRRDGDRG